MQPNSIHTVCALVLPHCSQGRPPFRHYSEAGQMEKLSIRDIHSSPPDSPIRHQNHGCCPVTYAHLYVPMPNWCNVLPQVWNHIQISNHFGGYHLGNTCWDYTLGQPPNHDQHFGLGHRMTQWWPVSPLDPCRLSSTRHSCYMPDCGSRLPPWWAKLNHEPQHADRQCSRGRNWYFSMLE